MTPEEIIERQQEITRALFLAKRSLLVGEEMRCQTMARWVRLRAKALWLAFRAWKVTRELRATRLRVLEQHRKNVEGLDE
jgi:ABC-type nickel/cobalt efflux system permease component RcnA